MLGKLTWTTAEICCRHLGSRAKQLVIPVFRIRHLLILERRASTFQRYKGTNLIVFKANFATSKRIAICTYDEVKSLPNHPEKLLIDVREPNELIETGKIPSSINIPLGSLMCELSPDFSPDAFEQKYNRMKPHKDSEIIFHCKSGKRSADAAEKATILGYTNVKSYEGSWLDWAEREGLPK